MSTAGSPSGALHLVYMSVCVHVYPITYTGWWFEPL